MANLNASDAVEVREDAANDLGPLLLQKKVVERNAIVFMSLGTVTFLMGLGFIWSAVNEANGPLFWMILAGGVFALSGLMMAGVGVRHYWPSRGAWLFLHERGIRERTRRGETVILYEDVDELEYKMTQVFVNGVYAGTDDHLRVRIHGEADKTIVFRRRRYEKKGFKTGIDEPNVLDAIANHIAERIATKVVHRLDEGQPFDWTSKMRIHPDGLEIVPYRWSTRPIGDWLKRQVLVRVSWDEVDKVDVNNGIFQLWIKGEAGPRVTIDVVAKNFHPGYRVLVSILRDRATRHKPPSVRNLEQGEKLALEIAWNRHDYLVRDRAVRLADPHLRKNDPIETLILIPVILTSTAIGAALNYLWGTIGLELCLVVVFGCIIIGPILFILLKFAFDYYTRRRVIRELKDAESLANLGQAADPYRTNRLILGPLGYTSGSSSGEIQRSWKEVSRIQWNRGYILFQLTGNQVDHGSIDIVIPPPAFDDRDRARDAFERIKQWHQSAKAG